MDTTNIGKIILLVFIYFVSVPLIIYYTYRFYQHKSSKTVLFRQPLLIVCLNFLVIASFIFDRTPRYLASVVGVAYPIWLQSSLSTITSYGIINVLALKAYLLFFQHRYHTAIQNQTWAKTINNNWNNWYICNKNKWGDFQYILKWLLIPYSIESFVTIFGQFIWGFMLNVAFQILFSFTPILLFLTCLIKLGQFNDSFGIRREMFMQCLLLIVGYIIYFPIISVSRLYLSEEKYNVLYEISQGIIVVTMYTMLAISSVYYPLYLIKKHKTKHVTVLPKSNNAINLANLLHCFVDYQMFSLFMHHLVKEFATESALFVVEWCQIKYAYQLSQNGVIKISKSEISNEYKVIDLNEILNNTCTLPLFLLSPAISRSVSKSLSLQDMLPHATISARSTTKSKSKLFSDIITTYIMEDPQTENMIKIQISRHIPESEILQKYPNDIKLQVKALYNKYIIDQSLTQINIPFTLKNPATKLMLKLESDKDDILLCDGDLWCSLDQICFNILGLLLNPYSRFNISQQYIDYVLSIEYKSKIKDLEMINLNHQNNASLYEEINMSKI